MIPTTVLEKSFSVMFYNLSKKYAQMSLVFRENPKNRHNNGISEEAVIRSSYFQLKFFRKQHWKRISVVSRDPCL